MLKKEATPNKIIREIFGAPQESMRHGLFLKALKESMRAWTLGIWHEIARGAGGEASQATWLANRVSHNPYFHN